MSSNKNNSVQRVLLFSCVEGEENLCTSLYSQGVSQSLGRVGEKRKSSLFSESTSCRLNIPASELGIWLWAAGEPGIGGHTCGPDVCWVTIPVSGNISMLLKKPTPFICLVLGSIVHLVVANHAVVQNKFCPNLLDWKKEVKALEVRSLLTDYGCGVAATCKRFLSKVHWCFWEGGKCSPNINSYTSLEPPESSWALLLVPHASH